MSIVGCLVVSAEEYSLIITPDLFDSKYSQADNSMTIYATNDKPYTINYKGIKWRPSTQGTDRYPHIIFYDQVYRDTTSQPYISGLVPNITKIVIDFTTGSHAGLSLPNHLNVCIGNDTIIGIEQRDSVTRHFLCTYYPYKCANDFYIFFNYIPEKDNNHPAVYDAECTLITVYFKNGDAVSGFDEMIISDKPNKILKNGKLIISKNNKYYTITGRQL